VGSKFHKSKSVNFTLSLGIPTIPAPSALYLLKGAVVFGYRAYSRHRDLAETLQWMDLTYNPHEGGENYGRGSRQRN
jgi:hypothetical protein